MSGPVRVAGDAERARIATLLARAFADDPAMAFIFPDAADRAKRLPRLFALLFDADALSGMRLLSAGEEAVTLWRGPGQARTGFAEMLAQAWPLWRTFGAALARGLAVSQAIDAHFPTGAFWYLHIAGCDPAAQGRGHGGSTIRAGLDRVAGGGLPTYLETANEKNIALYRALGFEVTGDWVVAKGGPRFWSMLRPGGASAAT